MFILTLFFQSDVFKTAMDSSQNQQNNSSLYKISMKRVNEASNIRFVVFKYLHATSTGLTIVLKDHGVRKDIFV